MPSSVSERTRELAKVIGNANRELTSLLIELEQADLSEDGAGLTRYKDDRFKYLDQAETSLRNAETALDSAYYTSAKVDMEQAVA